MKATILQILFIAATMLVSYLLVLPNFIGPIRRSARILVWILCALIFLYNCKYLYINNRNLYDDIAVWIGGKMCKYMEFEDCNTRVGDSLEKQPSNPPMDLEHQSGEAAETKRQAIEAAEAARQKLAAIESNRRAQEAARTSLQHVYRETQRELKNKGFYAGGIDGEWGEASRSAMEQFQKKAGRPVDGEASEAELTVLRNSDVRKYKEPQPKRLDKYIGQDACLHEGNGRIVRGFSLRCDYLSEKG